MITHTAHATHCHIHPKSACGFCFQNFRKHHLRLSYSDATLAIGFHPTQHTFLNKILFIELYQAVYAWLYRCWKTGFAFCESNPHQKITGTKSPLTTADFDMSMVSGFGVTCFCFLGTGRCVFEASGTFFLVLPGWCFRQETTGLASMSSFNNKTFIGFKEKISSNMIQ